MLDPQTVKFLELMDNPSYRILFFSINYLDFCLEGDSPVAVS